MWYLEQHPSWRCPDRLWLYHPGPAAGRPGLPERAQKPACGPGFAGAWLCQRAPGAGSPGPAPASAGD
nr:MAG TPA: hypothetical protein [Bacteriophage sp.]